MNFTTSSSQLKSLWKSFITANLLKQLVVLFLLQFTLVLVFMTIMILSGGENINNLAYYQDTAVALLIGGSGGRSPFWNFCLFSLIAFFTFIWQAAFIFKIMNTPQSVVFSDVISFYPADLSSKDELKKKEYIVFRLMNNGFSTIYNVKISVMLRVYDHISKTFQHYKCKVKNNDLPVFSPYMPFRIYIETGLISEAIDSALLNPYSTLNKVDYEGLFKNITIPYSEKIIRECDLYSNSFCFVVYAEGFDSELDQSKSFMKEYSFIDMKKGYFTAINPSSNILKNTKTPERMFSENEISNKFNSIDSNE